MLVVVDHEAVVDTQDGDLDVCHSLEVQKAVTCSDRGDVVLRKLEIARLPTVQQKNRNQTEMKVLFATLVYFLSVAAASASDSPMLIRIEEKFIGADGEPASIRMQHLTAEQPLFDETHPNALAPSSSLLPVTVWNNEKKSLETHSAWSRQEGTKYLTARNGDRILLFQAADHKSRFGTTRTKPNTEVFLVQYLPATSSKAIYFFMAKRELNPDYRKFDPPLVRGLQFFALYAPDSDAGISIQDIDFRSFDNFADTARDARVSSGGVGIPDRFFLANPEATTRTGGLPYLTAVIEYNQERDEKLAARDRRRAEALVHRKAFNELFLRECSKGRFIVNADTGGEALAAALSGVKVQNANCVVGTAFGRHFITIGGVSPGDCDLTLASGSCRVMMSYSCRFVSEFGTSIESPTCIALRIPQQKDIVFQNGIDGLAIVSMQSPG